MAWKWALKTTLATWSFKTQSTAKLVASYLNKKVIWMRDAKLEETSDAVERISTTRRLTRKTTTRQAQLNKVITKMTSR